MDIELLRAYCNAKPFTEETMPFGPGTLVYKVGGKAFLICSIEAHPLRFNVKCDPDLAVELRERYSCVEPGYHMNKRHWNTVLIDGSVPARLLKDWIDQSYNLVVDSLPKKLQLTIRK